MILYRNVHTASRQRTTLIPIGYHSHLIGLCIGHSIGLGQSEETIIVVFHLQNDNSGGESEAEENGSDEDEIIDTQAYEEALVAAAVAAEGEFLRYHYKQPSGFSISEIYLVYKNNTTA